MAYCTSADVGILLQQTYNTISQPTKAQVDSIVDQVAGEIDNILTNKGVVTPVTDVNVVLMLKKYNSFGAACITGITYFGNNSSVNDSQPAYYCKEYKEFIAELKSDPEGIIGTLGAEPFISNQVLDGTMTESEYNDNMIDQEFEY